MAVSPEFTTFVLEQLGRLVPGVKSRAMFGGVSISSGAGTFALIDDDTLYLKANKASRPLVEGMGWPAFQPFGGDSSTMSYFAVPGDLLDDTDAIRSWVQLALDAATAARARKKKGE